MTWMSTSAWMKNLIGSTPAVSGESIANLFKTVKSGSREDRKKAISDLNKLSMNPQSAKVHFNVTLILTVPIAYWWLIEFALRDDGNRNIRHGSRRHSAGNLSADNGYCT